MKPRFLRFVILIFAVFFCVPTTKAGMWDEFWVALTARGTHPTIKSYYLMPNETMEGVNYLEFQEYSNSLKSRLSEIGYEETSKEDAVLHIKLGYYIGAKETVSTQSSSSSYNISSISTNINSTKSTKSTSSANVTGFSGMAFGSGSKSSTSNSNTQIKSTNFSYGGNSTTTHIENGIPCYLSIEAINVKSGNPQWTLDMEVIVDNFSRFSNVFPWMCLISKWFIGYSFSGRVCIDNTKKKCYRIYNLPQHFDSGYWSLQYHYFRGSDIYIKKDPMPLVVK